MKEVINLRMNDFLELFLKHCPFCGSTEVVLENTHNPSYWVECQDCEAQIHGESYGSRKDYGSIASHKKSAKSAINKWNGRY